MQHALGAAGAATNACMQALQQSDRAAYADAATSLRVDGAWIDAGENDSVIIAAVTRMPHALGVIGYPQFVYNQARLSAAPVDGVTPSRDSISAEHYPLSRTLRVYAKAAALMRDAHARLFIEELTGPAATGPDGYLLKEGLIPLNAGS